MTNYNKMAYHHCPSCQKQWTAAVREMNGAGSTLSYRYDSLRHCPHCSFSDGEKVYGSVDNVLPRVGRPKKVVCKQETFPW